MGTQSGDWRYGCTGKDTALNAALIAAGMLGLLFAVITSAPQETSPPAQATAPPPALVASAGSGDPLVKDRGSHLIHTQEEKP